MARIVKAEIGNMESMFGARLDVLLEDGSRLEGVVSIRRLPADASTVARYELILIGPIEMPNDILLVDGG